MPNHPPRTPKEYQEEMMRLYRAAQASAPPPVPALEPPEEVPEPSPAPEPEPVLAPSPEPPPAPEPAAPEEPVVQPRRRNWMRLRLNRSWFRNRLPRTAHQRTSAGFR